MTQKQVRRMVLLIAALGVFVIPMAVNAAGGFTDVEDTNIFKADIDWLVDAGVTNGCALPANTLFCPKDVVTRETMAAFMHRLAVNKVVDAKTATNADNADTLDGKDSTAFMQYGPIVTTVGPAAWLRDDDEPGTVTRSVAGVTVSGDGAMVLGVQAPVSFNGVEYGLESVEICVEVHSPAVLAVVVMVRRNNATSESIILGDATARTTSGCYVYQVGTSVGRGAGIHLGFDGGSGSVVIGGTTLTWTTDAFVP